MKRGMAMVDMDTAVWRGRMEWMESGVVAGMVEVLVWNWVVGSAVVAGEVGAMAYGNCWMTHRR